MNLILRIDNTKENPMTSERIKEIQETTAYPYSLSVQQALLKVWNECEQSTVKLFSKQIVSETNPIGKDYIILSRSIYRDKYGDNKTACYEWVNGFKIYYTHKDNVHSR